jgi:ABC-type glycerol-3-phosphate transport system substrate-binding protein
MTGAKETALLDMAARFASENPYGIRLRVEFHSPLHTETLVAIADGTPPDIVVAQCEDVMEYAMEDAVVPLGEYIDSSKYGLSRLEKADLLPAVLQTGCLPDGSQQPLGLLVDSRLTVMFYNVYWLEQLQAEAPPRTWEEFRSLCNTATDQEAGTWGYAAAPDGSIVVNWVLGLGGVLVDPSGSEALLDSEEAIASLSVLSDLLEDECAYCAPVPDSDLADFAAGRVLFTFGSTDELTAYVAQIASQEGAEFDWRIAPVPHLTQDATVSIQGSTVSMLRTTPRQQLAAWLFLKWLLRPRNDAQWVLTSGALPMLKSTKYIPQVQAYLEQNPQYKAACDLRAYARPDPAVRMWQSIRTLLADAAAAVCQEQINPEDALAAADAAADSLLAE